MTDRVWDKAIDLLLMNEGGYVNDPNDLGGETKWGISKRAYPDLDIPNLTLDDAKAIYYRDYWRKCKCDKLPDALSVAVLDYAVNSGVKRAIKHLQEVLEVPADGIIGNQTIGACSSKPLKDTVQKYLDKRLDFLISLESFSRYGKGWTARVNRVRQFCEGLCG